MDPKLQLRVQRYGWDAAEPHYEDGWSEVLRPAHDTLFELARLEPGYRVIETACGTGLVTIRAAKIVTPSGTILATDLSGQMVGSTNERCLEAGYHWVTATRMDAQKLDAADREFDAAICALGLMYVPDTRAAIAEMARVVKPGGAVAVTVWGERKSCGWAEIFPIVDRQVASEVCPMFFGLGAPNALRRQFEEAGLGEIEEVRWQETMAFPDETALLHAMIDGGAVALAAKRFTPEGREQVETEFLQSVEESRTRSGSYAIPGEFVTIRGIKED
jgi:ubiquinone/menaquinone biosynthesis C-methylase UbiE